MTSLKQIRNNNNNSQRTVTITKSMTKTTLIALVALTLSSCNAANNINNNNRYYGTTTKNNYGQRTTIPAFATITTLKNNNNGISSINRQTSSKFLGNQFRFVSYNPKKQRQQPCQQRNGLSSSSRSSKSSQLNMFMGSDGGILGVGTPEVATILLVGYFVLGPSDLYKVVKEIGKFIQNFRTLGTDLTKTVETNLESQLQIEEIRKAQRELNDAFSFRRSINIDTESENLLSKPSSESEAAIAETAAVGATAVATAGSSGGDDADGTATKKKIKRRVLKKKIAVPEDGVPPIPDDNMGNVPDLDMPDSSDIDNMPSLQEMLAEERELMSKDSNDEPSSSSSSWYSDDVLSAGEESSTSTTTSSSVVQQQQQDPVAAQAVESNRFNSQLNAEQWNKSIMDNEDALSPLSKIMERLAILEDEKMAADKRLEEEFQKKAELEEQYYKDKRLILEEAAAEVQANVYNNNNNKE